MPTDKQLYESPKKDVRGRRIPPEGDSNLDPITGESGAHPVGTGVGATGGALAGAAIGAVGGPVGMAAGALVGAVTGGIVGKEVAESIDPTVGGRPAAGALTGSALGAVGGPPGMIAGAAVGAAVGGAAGMGVARAVNPAGEDSYWRVAHVDAPYYQSGRTYEDYEPAYRLGYYGWSRYGGAFDQSEDRLSNEWKSIKGQSRLTWNEAKQATRAAWDRVERAIPGDSDHDGK